MLTSGYTEQRNVVTFTETGDLANCIEERWVLDCFLGGAKE